jgi:hypothetical protein
MKLPSVWRLVIRTSALIMSLAALSLLGVYLFSQNRITGDAASHLLLAISPILKIGAPYKDFWDIKPPVLPLILYLWSNLFGFGILSIRIINIVTAALTVLVTWLVYRKIFRTPVLEVIFIFSIVLVLSPILNSIILPTELLGLLLSMGALYALIGFKKDFTKFYFSGLLFFAASQTKEPFTLTILATLPVFISSFLEGGFSRLFKNLVQFVLGVFTSFAAIYIYLAGFGSVGAYFEIFRYKQMFFPFTFERLTLNFFPGFYAVERTFIAFPRVLSTLIVLGTISFYLVNKFKKTLSFNSRNSRLIVKSIVVADPERNKKYAALFYSIGSFFGFGLGGSFGSHYLIQVVVPFYILGGFIVSYLFNSASFLFSRSKPYFYLTIFVAGLSVFIIFPKRPYFSVFLHEKINFSLTDGVHGGERRINELTTKDQCVLSVYGWGTGENYLYSQRRPCTRFFLANIVNQDWQKKEYAEEILENPPAVIAYQTLGADIDVQKFESEVINMSKIVKNCYIQDSIEKSVYIPKTRDTDNLKKCVRMNSI